MNTRNFALRYAHYSSLELVIDLANEKNPYGIPCQEKRQEKRNIENGVGKRTKFPRGDPCPAAGYRDDKAQL